LDQKFFGFGEGFFRVGGEIELKGVGIPIQRLVAHEQAAHTKTLPRKSATRHPTQS
jgi:antitoxin (DNA-binding transcriptional repressor) of toxin-antitoxin stability system